MVSEALGGVSGGILTATVMHHRIARPKFLSDWPPKGLFHPGLARTFARTKSCRHLRCHASRGFGPFFVSGLSERVVCDLGRSSHHAGLGLAGPLPGRKYGIRYPRDHDFLEILDKYSIKLNRLCFRRFQRRFSLSEYLS